MSDTILAEVPLISMKDQATDPDGFAQEFGRSFQRFGFAMVSDHGVPQEVVDRAWAMTKAFFALPEEEKRRYFVEGGGGARGYTPYKTEIAKGATFVDLKEFWHVGRELAKGHRFEADMALKQKLYGERYPIDETFLEALGTMPEASGVALGLDRLVMLATGASRIDQVIWTPFR